MISTFFSLSQPSTYNAQPWRFLVPDKGRDDVAFKHAFDSLVPFNRDWNGPVPVLIVVAAQMIRKEGKVNRYVHHDAGAATFAFVLQAHALGLAAHQISGFDAALLRTSLAVPDQFEIISVISLGHYGDGNIEQNREVTNIADLNSLFTLCNHRQMDF